MAAWRWRNVPLPEPHLAAIGAGFVLGLVLPWRLFPAGWPRHLVG
jgi:hypothetical protein